jgi:hypothetical protein
MNLWCALQVGSKPSKHEPLGIFYIQTVRVTKFIQVKSVHRIDLVNQSRDFGLIMILGFY